MIHEITPKNTPKHSGKTFVFKQGLNLIRGANESGKSSILEYIDFALHGNVALRLPVGMYNSNLGVDASFTINGDTYRVERTIKKAQLIRCSDEQIIASGIKPVDAEIRKILGYSRNVFMVSNYSSQDSINYLSTLKPAERKRTIDNVVGLTAVEAVIAEHKNELTMLNRIKGNIQVIEVSQPTNVAEDRIPNVQELINGCHHKINNELKKNIAVQESLRTQHQKLEENKPVELEKGDYSGFIEGLTEQKIAETQTQINFLNGELVKTRQQFESMVEPELLPEPSREGFIEGLTEAEIIKKRGDRQSIVSALDFTKDKLFSVPDVQQRYTLEKIKETEDQENLYSDWLAVNKLKSNGFINCNHCGKEVFLAQDALAEHYSHVPEEVSSVSISSASMKAHNEIMDKREAEREKLTSDKAKLEAELDQLNTNWYTEEQLKKHSEVSSVISTYEKSKAAHDSWKSEYTKLTDYFKVREKEIEQYADWYVPSQIEAHRQAILNFKKWQDNQREIEQWKNTKDSLEPFVGADQLGQWQLEIDQLVADIAKYEANKKQWSDYDSDLEKYENWAKQYAKARADVDLEQLNIAALNEYKQQIKTAILPSVNSVATQWMVRMSEGKHNKVELTDNMDILVNNEPIEALSISGRALGHLSLRMALGQVLTNHVFPVFMADEVDASMRNERGQNVLDALYDMLKGSMKQIILISHRDLEVERVSNFIEV